LQAARSGAPNPRLAALQSAFVAAPPPAAP
jgi:hypothetical protein